MPNTSWVPGHVAFLILSWDKFLFNKQTKKLQINLIWIENHQSNFHNGVPPKRITLNQTKIHSFLRHDIAAQHVSLTTKVKLNPRGCKMCPWLILWGSSEQQWWRPWEWTNRLRPWILREAMVAIDLLKPSSIGRNPTEMELNARDQFYLFFFFCQSIYSIVWCEVIP